MTHAYEDIARLLDALVPPETEGQFHVEWLGDQRIAVGIDARQRYALLIVGSAIHPRTDIVGSAVREGTWVAPDRRELTGSVLHLPTGDAFRTALATIAAELFRRRIDVRPASEVFTEVEPFIALVLHRLLFPDSYVLGLVGELLVLRELLVSDQRLRQLSDPTAIWRGWQHQSRDIVLGAAAIEVKATGLTVSRHEISGLEQVEPRIIDGAATEELFIVSVGLRRAAGDGGLSISGLAQEILECLSGGPDEGADGGIKFLDRLASYGPDGFDGYNHATMRDQEPYTHTFTTTFAPRVYDMSDDNIRIVRRGDLARDFGCVLPQGFRFTMELPDEVPGSIENPRTDLRTFLQKLASHVLV